MVELVVGPKDQIQVDLHIDMAQILHQIKTSVSLWKGPLICKLQILNCAILQGLHLAFGISCSVNEISK